MVWRYSGEGATHKIWPGSIQRFPRNLSLRTDACAMTVALLIKSSRAKNRRLYESALFVLLRKDKHWLGTQLLMGYPQ